MIWMQTADLKSKQTAAFARNFDFGSYKHGSLRSHKNQCLILLLALLSFLVYVNKQLFFM